jgi:hypothetical protein
MRTGKSTDFFTSSMSWWFAGSPVAVPVMMTPSERKNSAALAVSSKFTSDVIAWELRMEK